MAIRDYTGTELVRNDRYEPGGVLLPEHRRVEWDEDDGSRSVGYELPDGRLTGSTFALSAARLAALAAENAPRVATDAQIAAFKTSIVTLAAVVAANSGTVAQQAAAQRALLVKLSRAVLGIMSDP